MTADNFRFAQLQNFSLAGGGAVAGATSITLKSMTDIDGNALTMAGTFGTIGFGTLEPGNGALEEQISFTGLTTNSNGTVTLSGVSSVTFVYPYTQTSGLAKTHAGSTTFVISNTSGFYDEMNSKLNDETITGTWTFPSADPTRAGIGSDVDTAVATAFVTLGQLSRQAISGASNASTTVKGIVQLATQAQADARTTTGSTGALLVNTPDLVRDTLLSDYKADTGAANAYVITPVPAISAYTVGQIFTFKATNANTTTSTLNVNGKGATTIKKLNGSINLNVGDIAAGQIVQVEYDGTNFQMINPAATSIKFGGTGADGALAIASGTTTVDLANAKVVTKNYSSISITGTGTLAFINPHAGGTLLILKSQGNVTLTSSSAPMLDCSGLGAAADTNGNLVFDGVTHKGSTGNAGGNAVTSTPGAAGASQATIGLIYTNQDQYLSVLGTLARRGVWIVPGAGGGSGGIGGNGVGGTTGGTAGAGGRGGGALLMECGGALNFTTASGISVAGIVGTVGGAGTRGTGGGAISGSGGGGGGGGGAGGNVVILYNTLTANSGTINILGGAGGAGGIGGGVDIGTSTNAGGGSGSGGTAAAAFTTLANASGAGSTGGAVNLGGSAGSAGGANGHGGGGGSGAGSSSGGARADTSGGTGGAALAASGSSLVLVNTEFV